MSKRKIIIKICTLVIVTLSMVFGIILLKASGSLLQESFENGRSVVNTTADGLYSFDAEAFYRTRVYGSATAVVGSCFQFLVSLVVLGKSLRGDLQSPAILIWIGFHIVIMLTIYGSYLGIITTNYNHEIQISNEAIGFFIPTCLGDLAFILTAAAIELIIIRMYL